ncbi:hypothetical protein [Lactiplantibacillus plantarum]|uniref:hypothetical protein n=1 Tax=Lactiplantibacillus plantarum TaxID=1590 RepID=UPI0040456F8F
MSGALVAAGCIDELLIYMAPMLLGDAAGVVKLPMLERLDAAPRYEFIEAERVAADLRLRARVPEHWRAYQNDAILYFSQARAAGFKPKVVIGAGGGYSLADTAKAVGADMNGVFDLDFPQSSINPAGAPGLDKFLEAYKATYKMYESTTRAFAQAYYHWFWLIQPAPMPETMIERDPVFYLRSVMGGRPGGLAHFSDEAMAEYERTARLPGWATGICED